MCIRVRSWTELPWYWAGTDNFLWAMCLVVLAPGLLALVFGFFAFRSRIKGVYFSIMTQALTFAGMLLFFRNETGFGGNNGFTNFRSILGFSISSQGTRATLFLATVILLVVSLYIGWRLAQSKFGRVLTALRDAENRLMFCGYDPDSYTQVASCCLLYTSDAADDSLRVDLGGRRIIKKKKKR